MPLPIHKKIPKNGYDTSTLISMPPLSPLMAL